jgi:small subunit ribosomal protein S15
MVKEEKMEAATVEEAAVEKTESKSAKPSWVKMKSADLEKLVVALAKEGNDPAKIGLILRDKHGVPKAKLFGKRISQILKEHGIEFKTEKKVVEEKISTLQNHFGKNKHDYQSSKALSKKLWVLHAINKN